MKTNLSRKVGMKTIKPKNGWRTLFLISLCIALCPATQSHADNHEPGLRLKDEVQVDAGGKKLVVPAIKFELLFVKRENGRVKPVGETAPFDSDIRLAIVFQSEPEGDVRRVIVSWQDQSRTLTLRKISEKSRRFLSTESFRVPLERTDKQPGQTILLPAGVTVHASYRGVETEFETPNLSCSGLLLSGIPEPSSPAATLDNLLNKSAKQVDDLIRILELAQEIYRSDEQSAIDAVNVVNDWFRANVTREAIYSLFSGNYNLTVADFILESARGSVAALREQLDTGIINWDRKIGSVKAAREYLMILNKETTAAESKLYNDVITVGDWAFYGFAAVYSTIISGGIAGPTSVALAPTGLRLGVLAAGRTSFAIRALAGTVEKAGHYCVNFIMTQPAAAVAGTEIAAGYAINIADVGSERFIDSAKESPGQTLFQVTIEILTYKGSFTPLGSPKSSSNSAPASSGQTNRSSQSSTRASASVREGLQIRRTTAKARVERISSKGARLRVIDVESEEFSGPSTCKLSEKGVNQRYGGGTGIKPLTKELDDIYRDEIQFGNWRRQREQSSGQPLSVEDALDQYFREMAEIAGVDIPDDVRLRFVDDPPLMKDRNGKVVKREVWSINENGDPVQTKEPETIKGWYLRPRTMSAEEPALVWNKHRDARALSRANVNLRDVASMQDEQGIIWVNFDKNVDWGPESSVHILAHELHEIARLRGDFLADGSNPRPRTGGDIMYYLNEGQYHQEAWDAGATAIGNLRTQTNIHREDLPSTENPLTQLFDEATRDPTSRTPWNPFKSQNCSDKDYAPVVSPNETQRSEWSKWINR